MQKYTKLRSYSQAGNARILGEYNSWIQEDNDRAIVAERE